MEGSVMNKKDKINGCCRCEKNHRNHGNSILEQVLNLIQENDSKPGIHNRNNPKVVRNDGIKATIYGPFRFEDLDEETLRILRKTAHGDFDGDQLNTHKILNNKSKCESCPAFNICHGVQGENIPGELLSTFDDVDYARIKVYIRKAVKKAIKKAMKKAVGKELKIIRKIATSNNHMLDDLGDKFDIRSILDSDYAMDRISELLEATLKSIGLKIVPIDSNDNDQDSDSEETTMNVNGCINSADNKSNSYDEPACEAAEETTRPE